MVGRKDRIKDPGISETEYKLLFVIAAVFSILVIYLSLNRTLAESWAVRALIIGFLSSILIYYSKFQKTVKAVSILVVWVLSFFLVLLTLELWVRIIFILVILGIAVYAWMRRPLPQQSK